jgi:hypothetical protein
MPALRLNKLFRIAVISEEINFMYPNKLYCGMTYKFVFLLVTDAFIEVLTNIKAKQRHTFTNL